MRIKTIKDFINNANMCVDVGSDHAHLSLFLINENRSKHVYNIEKNDGPLQNSIKNTISYKNRIFNIKSDGFKNFDSLINIDYCTISGMGTSTIINILNDCKNNVKNFVICSNNNYDVLRKWIKKNKYKIYDEKTILENEIFYEIICFSKEKGYRLFFNNQIKFGIRKIKKNDNLYIQKLKYELEKSNFLFFKDKNKEKYKKYKNIERYIKKYDNR